MSPPTPTIACQSANILSHLSAISSNYNLLTIGVFACASKEVRGVQNNMKRFFATQVNIWQQLIALNKSRFNDVSVTVNYT